MTLAPDHPTAAREIAAKLEAGKLDDGAPSARSLWADRLRNAAVILLVAGLVLAAMAVFGDLPVPRALIAFACIVCAALVPWRLRGVDIVVPSTLTANPVEAPAVAAIVSGVPDPTVLLDRAGRVIHLNAAAAQLAPALRKGELAQFALRSVLPHRVGLHLCDLLTKLLVLVAEFVVAGNPVPRVTKGRSDPVAEVSNRGEYVTGPVPHASDDPDTARVKGCDRDCQKRQDQKDIP